MRSSAEKLAALQKLWDLYRSILANKGLDIASRFKGWAEKRRQSLDKQSAAKSFARLCEAGCKTLPLAILMAIIRPMGSFEKKWKTITGTTRQRQQRIRSLENAADVLEDLLGSLADVIVADSRLPTETDDREDLRRELITPSIDLLAHATKGSVPDPATTIRALRVYASILRLYDSPQEEARAIPSGELGKYLFSAYVSRATGRPHDAEVSTLIEAALDAPYDETAHRMWRARNYERLNNTFSGIADMLVEFGFVSET